MQITQTTIQFPDIQLQTRDAHILWVSLEFWQEYYHPGIGFIRDKVEETYFTIL